MALPPNFEAAEVEVLAAERFGLSVHARVLHGYSDKNFLLQAEDGRRWVLKIAHQDEHEDCLAAQDQLLERLAQQGLAVPRVVADKDGRRLGTTTARDGCEHLVRLVDWLPGQLLIDVEEPGEELLEDVGAFVGRVALALASFDHPALHRRMQWDLAQALDVRAFSVDIDDAQRRAWVEAEYARFEERGLARLRACPQAAVHGDANDHNILVGGDPLRVSGLIDFGDAVHTARVCDVAIAAAYAMLAKSDPLAAAAAVLRGYRRLAQLTADEEQLVLDLACLRVAVSATFAAHEALLRPGDAYFDVSRTNTWALIEQLSGMPRDEANEAFLRAAVTA